MSTFSAIPKIPEGVGDEWETDILSALSRNVSLLSGEIRGSRALLKEMITVRLLPDGEFSNVTALGKRTVIPSPIAGDESLLQLVTLDDYNNLVRDVVRLSQDVQAIRATLSALISQIRG